MGALKELLEEAQKSPDAAVQFFFELRVWGPGCCCVHYFFFFACAACGHKCFLLSFLWGGLLAALA